MPGLVKIGRTSRTPNDRANELSGVSGVPTPFMVVYDEYFGDCQQAEEYVHTRLSGMGLRVSENREFFQAPVSEVVKAFASIPATVDRARTPPDELLTPDGPEFDEFALECGDVRPPWEALMEEADRHHYGLDGYLEDDVEAVKLYRDAAKLGSPMAYHRLGDAHSQGWGVPEDAARALSYYKEGAKKGNYLCFGGMAALFLEAKHYENVKKAIFRMITQGEQEEWALDEWPKQHIGMLSRLLFSSWFGPKPLRLEMYRLVAAYLPAVVDYMEEQSTSLPDARILAEQEQLTDEVKAFLHHHPEPPPRLTWRTSAGG